MYCHLSLANIYYSYVTGPIEGYSLDDDCDQVPYTGVEILTDMVVKAISTAS